MIQFRFFLILFLPLILLACSGDPQQKAYRLAQTALEAQLQGDYKTATDRLEQAIQLDPDFPEAYVGLGQMYNYQEKYKEAKECYEKAIEQFEKRIQANPDRDTTVNALVNQAAVYSLLMRFGSARSLLQKALDMDPENPTAEYFLHNMKEFAAAWNQVPPPHPSEQKIQRDLLAPLHEPFAQRNQ